MYDAYVAPGAVHDGDTLRAAIPVEVKIRVDGIQAPELATPAGKVSAARVKQLLEGQWVTLTVRGDYKYGGERMGSVTTPDGRDLGAQLIAEGLAVKWDGRGPRPVG